MKSVLISIQPKWVEKICKKIGEENGKPIYKKRIEVRKGRPNEPTPIKCLIYCTYGQLLYADYPNGADSKVIKLGDYKVSGKDKIGNMLNGKVIGEFVCDKITDISVVVRNCNEDYNYVYYNDECKGSCLTWRELQAYGKGKTLYGWHISDLKIYDKPKELSEFKTVCKIYDLGFELEKCCECKKAMFDEEGAFCGCDRSLKGAPQSWCYVEVEK